MSNENEKKQPAPKKATGTIKHLWFTMAYDFPGTQEMHIACSPEPRPNGITYVATYNREDACFELQVYQAGKLAADRCIPREHVKQYERAT